MNNKFCYECGDKLIIEDSEYFDEETGKKLKVMRCKNTKCQIGCANTGGHYKGWKSYFRGYCKICTP